jgi:hypothetical protein
LGTVPGGTAPPGAGVEVDVLGFVVVVVVVVGFVLLVVVVVVVVVVVLGGAGGTGVGLPTSCGRQADSATKATAAEPSTVARLRIRERRENMDTFPSVPALLAGARPREAELPRVMSRVDTTVRSAATLGTNSPRSQSDHELLTAFVTTR